MKNKIMVNKVKYQKVENKILAEYLIQRNGQFDAVKLLSSEEAAPEFYNALDTLIPSVCEILELPRDLFEDRITPLAVAFKYDAAGNMGAIITSVLYLPETKEEVAVNTPLHWCRKNAEGAHVSFTDGTEERLRELESEARRYISGQRAQMSLFGVATETEKGTSDDDAANQAAQMIPFPETMAR